MENKSVRSDEVSSPRGTIYCIPKGSVVFQYNRGTWDIDTCGNADSLSIIEYLLKRATKTGTSVSVPVTFTNVDWYFDTFYILSQEGSPKLFSPLIYVPLVDENGFLTLTMLLETNIHTK